MLKSYPKTTLEQMGSKTTNCQRIPTFASEHESVGVLFVNWYHFYRGKKRENSRSASLIDITLNRNPLVAERTLDLYIYIIGYSC